MSLRVLAVLALVAVGVAGCKSNEYQGPGKRWTQKRDGRQRELRPDVWDRSEMMADYQVRFQDLNKQETELRELNRKLDVAIANGDQSGAYQLSKEREAADHQYCVALTEVRLLRARLLDSGVRHPGIRLLEIQNPRPSADIRNNIEAYLDDDITREVLIKPQDNLTYEEYGKRL